MKMEKNNLRKQIKERLKIQNQNEFECKTKSEKALENIIKTDFFERAKTKNEKAVTYYNHIWESEDVVRTALRDAYRGKDVSIHGFSVKAQVFLTKLLPHSLVMSIWMRQQGHK